MMGYWIVNDIVLCGDQGVVLSETFCSGPGAFSALATNSFANQWGLRGSIAPGPNRLSSSSKKH